jgi:hypothetical protein
VERRQQRHGSHGHFLGFWARLNCENMPVIPAWIVRSNLNDPRKIPYLLIWRDERHGGEIKEAVRLARYVDPNGCYATDNHVELKRTDGTITILLFAWRMLPRNGGRALLLVCSYCNTPRRHVYGWEWDSFSDGRTGSEVSAGDAVHVLDCATLPRAAICVRALCGGLWGTCHGRSHGFRLCSRHRKMRQKRASVNCHPSVGTGNGENPTAALDRAPESQA